MAERPFPTALDLPMVDPLPDPTQKYFDICLDKLGMVPNVLRAYAFDIEKLDAFTGLYNTLMLGPSGLSKLEREMIAVVVSSINRCFYCLVAHGAAVRHLSGDPQLGDGAAAAPGLKPVEDDQQPRRLGRASASRPGAGAGGHQRLRRQRLRGRRCASGPDETQGQRAAPMPPPEPREGDDEQSPAHSNISMATGQSLGSRSGTRAQKI